MEIEHVTYGIYHRPEIFKLSNFPNESDCSLERWTVDYQEDMDFVRAIFKAFSGQEAVFTYQDVRDFLKCTPELKSFMQAHKRNESLYFDKNRA